MAFIVKRAGHELSEKDVLTFCEGKLAKYKIPKHIVFLTELPKNDAGKIDRLQLRKISESIK